MIPVANLDQLDAACREVQLYVSRLAADPNDSRTTVTGDEAINHAIRARLESDLESETIEYCCDRCLTPRPLYWLPRFKAMLCQAHWDIASYCVCFQECDACRRDIEEGSIVFLFLKMYIIQAVLCVDCEARTRLSPAGG